MFTLPKLPYAYNALEPVIDEATMQIHHSKHHQAYIDKLNAALAGTATESESLEKILTHVSELPMAVRNNAGGHFNHTFFWEQFAAAPQELDGALREKIVETWGSFESMKTEFETAGVGQFGSGWVWLILNNQGKLEITSTPNQDNPHMDVVEKKGTPLLGIDVWEHAYYLKYQNKRADYLAAVWSKVDWSVVAQRFSEVGG